MRFNKAKCKGEELLKSRPAEKDLKVLVNKVLDMIQHSVLAVQKANYILDCIERRVASRAREVIAPLYCVLMRTHLEY